MRPDNQGDQLLSSAPGSILELRTKLPDLTQADDGAGERGEGEVDVGPPFVADGEAAEPRQPRQGALHGPPLAAQPSAVLDAAAGDAGAMPR